jgi:hypothetical protein
MSRQKSAYRRISEARSWLHRTGFCAREEERANIAVAQPPLRRTLPPHARASEELCSPAISSAFGWYFQSRMGWAILCEVRIARSCSGYENCRGLITCEGEVGRVSGLCIERTLRKHARLSVVGFATISKVPVP